MVHTQKSTPHWTNAGDERPQTAIPACWQMNQRETCDMDSNPTTIQHLPEDPLQQIFSYLPLLQIFRCRCVCKRFNLALTCPSFLHFLSLRHENWVVLIQPSHARTSHRNPSKRFLNVYDANRDEWLRFSLDFLPFSSTIPVAASRGLLYLWGELDSIKSLILCNPLTQHFKVLPPLGSAWFRHGTVLLSGSEVLVLSELVALHLASEGYWRTFNSCLSSKPRSPLLCFGTVYALCDVGSPWRTQWKLICYKLDELGNGQAWNRLEKQEWSDIFDILKRPRLIQGKGRSLLMIGGFKSSFPLNSSCSTILILRLDLDTLEWDEAGRMPVEFYRSFHELGKFKVFGGGERLYFSGKRVGKLAMWDFSDAGKGSWRWVENVPGSGDGVFRGFSFAPKLDAVP